MRERLQNLLIAHGALVLLLGLLAGFPYIFVIIGKIALWPIPGSIAWTVPGDVRGWRQAHFEGILNGLILIAVAAVVPRLVLSERSQRFVAWGLVITAWANVIASVIGPIFGGRGLAFGGSPANSLMYLLFLVAGLTVIAAIWLVFRGAVATKP